MSEGGLRKTSRCMGVNTPDSPPCQMAYKFYQLSYLHKSYVYCFTHKTDTCMLCTSCTLGSVERFTVFFL